MKDLELTPEDIEALRGIPRCTLELDAGAMMSIMGALHLAMRHPRFQGPSRDCVESFAMDLEERLGVTPRLALIFAAGRDPAHDVPFDDERRIIVP